MWQNVGHDHLYILRQHSSTSWHTVHHYTLHAVHIIESMHILQLINEEECKRERERKGKGARERGEGVGRDKEGIEKGRKGESSYLITNVDVSMSLK